MKEDQETEKLSRKEFAKKLRREAYQRAKEYKKNDPREVARKEKAKEQRRETYQKVKERNKAAKKEKDKKPKLDLTEQLVMASELDERPLAPVISLDSVRQKVAGKKTTRPEDL
jgi:CRISPR/Cas system-associated endonuclease Cas3-HD